MNGYEKLYLYDDIFVKGNEYNGSDMQNSFEFTDRNSKIIFSSPHSTRSTLNNRLKITDLHTGSIVKFIADKNNLSSIVRTKYITIEENIWDYVVKNNIENKFFLDFHGTHMDNDFNLALGTGYFDEEYYAKEIVFIKELAKDLDIKVVINHPSYRGRVGLTGHLQQFKSSNKVLQFEWRPDYRNFYTNMDTVVNKTIPFMESFASFVND